MRAAAATLIAQAHGTSAKEVTDSRVINVILALLVGYLHLSFAAPELASSSSFMPSEDRPWKRFMPHALT
jgi:hypothetical protein